MNITRILDDVKCENAEVGDETTQLISIQQLQQFGWKDADMKLVNIYKRNMVKVETKP